MNLPQDKIEYTDETIKRAIEQYEQDIMTLNCCIQGLKMEIWKR